MEPVRLWRIKCDKG